MSNANLVKTGRLRRSPQGQGTLYPVLQTAKSAQPKPVFRVLEDSATSDALVPKTEHVMAKEQVMAKEKCKSDNAQYQVLRHLCAIPFVYAPFPSRFLVKIAFLSNGCWQWTAGVRRHALYPGHAYGTFSKDGTAKGQMYAHRYSYITVNGEIPTGLELDHICRNKLCVNPEHLQVVTHQENCSRRLRSGPKPGFKQVTK